MPAHSPAITSIVHPDVAYVYKDFAAGFEKANSKANMIEVIGFNGETEKIRSLAAT